MASDAYAWSIPGAAHKISQKRRDAFVEQAYLSAFLSWEVFLEEAFLLYLLGQKAPRGRSPVRYAFPPSRDHAEDFVREDRNFATWSVSTAVTTRAKRFFREGRPFAPALQAHQSRLDEARTIRNAVAHESSSAREKFENLVRLKLTTLPPKTTVGGFLLTMLPGTSPPTTVMEHYFTVVETAAALIVPRT